MKRPETLYAWNGDVSLAYQVDGDGDVALLYGRTPGPGSRKSPSGIPGS